jgi:hypothetical protein
MKGGRHKAGSESRADGKVRLFTKSITLKNGRRVFAADHGLDAFCIWVDPNKKKRR